MIILVIALATILTFVTWMLIDNNVLRYVLGILSIIFLGWSVYILTDHFVNHTGMEVKSKTTTKQVYSAGSSSVPYGMVITKEVGKTSGNYVLVYKDKSSDKKASAHFIPNTKNVTEAVKKSASYKTANVKKATVKTTTKRYIWKSDFYESLFGFAGEEGDLVSKKSVLTVPKDTWLVLSQSQAKKLQTLVPKLKAQSQAQMKANPQAAKAMMTLAKTNPDKYAAMQVQTIKKALNIK